MKQAKSGRLALLVTAATTLLVGCLLLGGYVRVAMGNHRGEDFITLGEPVQRLSVSSYSNGRQVCANAGPFDNASLEIEYTQLANNKVSVKLCSSVV
jgi:hypothetical protein